MAASAAAAGPDARALALAPLPMALRDASTDMSRLPAQTANATAQAVTGALRASPGRIAVDVTVHDNLTRVRATPTAQPGGFNITTANTVQQVAG